MRTTSGGYQQHKLGDVSGTEFHGQQPKFSLKRPKARRSDSRMEHVQYVMQAPSIVYEVV